MADFQLREDQVQHFRTEGYVILRGFVELSVLQGWREQFWHHMAASGAREDDAETWPHTFGEEDYFSPREPLFGDLPQVRRVLEQLGAAGFRDGTRPREQTDMLIPNMPEQAVANGLALGKVGDYGSPDAPQLSPHIVRSLPAAARAFSRQPRGSRARFQPAAARQPRALSLRCFSISLLLRRTDSQPSEIRRAAPASA